MATSRDVDYAGTAEQDVQLLHASVAYARVHNKALEQVKKNIAAAVASATQMPVTCRVPLLNQASIDSLGVWVGIRGWKLTYNTGTDTAPGYGGDYFESRYYYVLLERADVQ